jgi:hypothetical protein
MKVPFLAAGGLVECSTSTTAKPRDVIARIIGQNAVHYYENRIGRGNQVPLIDTGKKPTWR